MSSLLTLWVRVWRLGFGAHGVARLRSISMYQYLSIYLSIYLPTYLSIYLSIYVSIYLPN